MLEALPCEVDLSQDCWKPFARAETTCGGHVADNLTSQVLARLARLKFKLAYFYSGMSDWEASVIKIDLPGCRGVSDLSFAVSLGDYPIKMSVDCACCVNMRLCGKN